MYTNALVCARMLSLLAHPGHPGVDITYAFKLTTVFFVLQRGVVVLSLLYSVLRQPRTQESVGRLRLRVQSKRGGFVCAHEAVANAGDHRVALFGVSEAVGKLEVTSPQMREGLALPHALSQTLRLHVFVARQRSFSK